MRLSDPRARHPAPLPTPLKAFEELRGGGGAEVAAGWKFLTVFLVFVLVFPIFLSGNIKHLEKNYGTS